jgi:MYXO-CTERM domain-containing protein
LYKITNLLRAGAVAIALLITAAVLPVAAQTSADQGTTTDHDGGFDDWGLLGLLGLAGLLGRKRERTTADTRRV